jgi:hypothetical protein
LVLFKPLLKREITQRENDALRRLGRILGDARDWDDLVLETLPAIARKDPDKTWAIGCTSRRHLAPGNAVEGKPARPDPVDAARLLRDGSRKRCNRQRHELASAWGSFVGVPPFWH